ncbi:MAG: serine hydrolase [Planctomycetota bacterium]
MKRILRSALVLLALGAWPAWRFGLAPLVDTIEIALGYAATVSAMQHFATGDDVDTIRAERLPAEFSFLSITVDADTRTATASAFGLLSRTARYRPGLGATRTEVAVGALPGSLVDLVATPPVGEPWPEGSSPELSPLPAGVSAAALDAALDAAFVDPETGLERGTHAVLVACGGRLVAERYAEPYGPRTPLLGWSMTKSVTATLIGRLIHEGRLALDAPAPIPEWSAADDPRAAIRLDDLLRMRSGLEFQQNHEDASCDSLNMLFVSGDCGAYAAGKELAHAPGTHWSYSDGTSNVLARLVRAHGGGTLDEQLTFPQRLLFAPLGLDTAWIAVDGSGTFVGSSLMYASARDWARFGLLYLRDGVWNGERLLPEGWVDYVSSRTDGSRNGRYGAHFWRYDADANAAADGRLFPAELEGVFYAAGYQRQYVFLDRARDLVLVRLGVRPEPPGFDPKEFAAAVLRCFDA